MQAADWRFGSELSTATHQSELLKTIYTKRSLSEIQTQLPKPRFDDRLQTMVVNSSSNRRMVMVDP